MQDLPEPALAESAAKVVAPETSAAAPAPETPESTVEKQDGDHDPASVVPPTAPETAAADSTTSEERKTTTNVRKPLEIPNEVNVKITAENLLDYVGPPLYQKDRLYTKRSPVGVSTGLGYLGNGSGAVMPIEVTVSILRMTAASQRYVTDDAVGSYRRCPEVVSS